MAEDRNMPRDELLRQAADADVLVSTLPDAVNRELFEAAPRLKLVANFAVGVDNIDLAEAAARGVAVANTPGVLTESTADVAMLLILAVARRLVEGDRLVRRGDFHGISPEFFLGFDLQGKTLGIYGLGRSGWPWPAGPAPSACASSTTTAAPPGSGKGTGGAPRQLWRNCCANRTSSPSTPADRRDPASFHPRRIAAMKPSAIIVNTGRGSIIREADLAEALEQGRIAGAGLDVYEFEPGWSRAVGPGQRGAGPHIGSATVRCGRAWPTWWPITSWLF